MTILKTNTIILALLLTIGLFSACKKHHHDDDPVTAEITIYTPTELQAFESGDTVWIKSKITGSAELHGYEVHLLRQADTTEVFLDDQHVEATTFDINDYWVNDGSIHSDMTLEIIANLDHDGNKVSKKVNFHCHMH